MISTVNVVELDPALLLAVAVYVPPYETPVMTDLVSVELALGGLRPVLVIVTPSIRVMVEFCVHTILYSSRLKSENVAINTRSSPTLNVRVLLLPAVGATVK